ncbi:DUF885 family protein [Maribacter antarcticus]|uniref:DUF885 family protein n=1 Tax=Maribacter antarcticus TaxID=505250 RepID=UPI000479188E|nr:DUF885 family protein [Maribacter antarcticus]
MKTFTGIWLLLILTPFGLFSQDLGEDYILEWKKFHPSKALNLGMRPSVFQYEDRSNGTIIKWLGFNERILTELSATNSNIDPIDGRLLRVKAQSEVDKWKTLSEHTTSLRLYSKLIKKAIISVFKADYLLSSEKSILICDRLTAITELAKAAQSNLKQVSKIDLEKGLEDLGSLSDFLQKDLEKQLQSNGLSKTCKGLYLKLTIAIQSVEELKKFSTSTLKKNTLESVSILGEQEYDRRLSLYTDSNLTSKKLAEMALAEIQTVKGLMNEVSRKYITETYPDKALPKNDLEIINLALSDMEKDAPISATDYLQFWKQLANSAIKFIKEKDIATLPKNNTLNIQTASESAGAAARIGWVASAPPFDPNPVTTLNLPSIPETLPIQEQIDFWASFNKPFNRMIVIHELYPGHYMQLKISRETPHPIRMLFPYGIYIEGWATFAEKVVLDAGWESGNSLTYLAHLRKRLENANRAYTSVKVHCTEWNQEHVLKFSTETSLLAPQFAKSLWGRIMNSPMQLTSYYLGGTQFTKLLKTEKERLGNNFNLKLFMDTVMKAGPIPIDEFYPIFKNTKLQ